MIKLLVIVALVGVTIADPIPNVSAMAGFPEGRIIGGEITSIEDVPYQVSISVGGMHYCGGSIIEEYWILTAAHCATGAAEVYTVRAGSSSSRSGGSLHKVAAVISHEKYFLDDNGIPSNDIALFRLSTPIVIDDSRQPITRFHTNESAPVGVYSVITGWGTIDASDQSTTTRLRTVSIPIISKDDCRRAYEKLTNFNPGQICAAYPQGGKDACQGDSGGPLVISRRLAGVVSWGNGCAIAGNPGVYTEVAYFNEWINEVMRTWVPNSSSMLTSTLSLGGLALMTIGCIVLTN